MDTEGARALAARIAAGPPGEDGDPKPETPQDAKTETPREPEPAAAPESAVEIVYLKPEQAPRHEVRIYVRGRDGSLERQP
jgi:hypothetical protein